jgi:hypothetical protein
VQAVAVPAAVGAVAKLAAEVNAEPEVARVAIERAADSAAQLSEGVAAPKTLENAAEIGAAAAGVAVEQVLGEQNPGLFVAAAADGAGKTIVFCFGCLFSFRFCSANVAVPKITPGEPPKDFVKDELAREQIASVAVEKVAAEQLVNEGLDAQSVAKGVQSGVKLAAEDVERKAMKVAEVKRGKDKKDFFEKKKKKTKKYADAPSAARIAANAAGATAERLAAAQGASPEEAREVGDKAASAAIDIAAPMDKVFFGFVLHFFCFHVLFAAHGWCKPRCCCCRCCRSCFDPSVGREGPRRV